MITTLIDLLKKGGYISTDRYAGVFFQMQFEFKQLTTSNVAANYIARELLAKLQTTSPWQWGLGLITSLD